MAIDYDLVVIGSSRVGVYAAQNAVQLQARVALVTQSKTLCLPDNSFASNALAEAGDDLTIAWHIILFFRLQIELMSLQLKIGQRR